MNMRNNIAISADYLTQDMSLDSTLNRLWRKDNYALRYLNCRVSCKIMPFQKIFSQILKNPSLRTIQKKILINYTKEYPDKKHKQVYKIKFIR